jgi:transcriptional regulator with XRE-family HTH domain
MDLQNLGLRIRLQREKRGLKQQDIAHALQVSPQAVSKWERGENAPDVGLLLPLARLLGVSIDWLMGGYEDDPDVLEATVLASGMQIARHKSEELKPRAFADWINAHCFQATGAVLRFDGIPVKYIGPGILCFFSGTGHAERAIRAGEHLCEISSDDLKIGIATGPVYFGAIGHPEYAHPDVIGEPVSIALLAMDWIADQPEGAIAATAATMQQTEPEFRSDLPHTPEISAQLPGIAHEVVLVPIVDPPMS